MSEKGVIVNKQGVSTDGTKGGLFVGKRHSQGGIEVDVVGGGKVEVETDEALIKNGSANTSKTVSFDGKQMTPKEVLSKINTAYNGVPIKKKGGEIEPEEDLSKRWDKKITSVKTLSNNIRKLRYNVSNDLKSQDEKTFLTALAIRLMDITAERVGNETSAENGHVGITGLEKNHIKIVDNKIFLNYTGKSGVEHEKTITDTELSEYLKKAIKNSSTNYVFCTSDGFCIKNNKINRYLNKFNISAKDIRGYSANNWIIERLKNVDISNKETQRKRQFNEQAKLVAKKVGHGLATLKTHYLIPEIEYEFIEKAKLINISDLKMSNGGNLQKGDVLKMGVKNYIAQRKSEKEIGKPVVVEGGAIVITRNAVLDNKTKHEFNGKMLTNKEILSEINKMNGGVDFAKVGNVDCGCEHGMKQGGKLSKTPAPKKDRIYGSKVNKENSSKDLLSSKEIKFDATTLLSISNKVKEHNKKHPNKKITYEAAKAVVRRGMGAYSSSHRPTIKGGKPNSRVAWGLARLNAFLYKVVNGKSKSGNYSQDDDLMDELNIPHKKFKEGGKILLAPNGKPSNLTPEQYDLVRTPAFKKWFGDWLKVAEAKINHSGIDDVTLENLGRDVSKVVDENGEPKIMYHGSRGDFNVFSNKNENKLSWTEGGFGFYFTSNYNYALGYGERVINAFINSRAIKKSNESEHALVNENDLYKLRKSGFDSIYFDGKFTNTSGKRSYKDDELVVFEPNQIKLADGTNTTFDANNPDIRYDMGGILPEQGTLYTKDKTRKLEYIKKGNEYVFKVYDAEINPVKDYKRSQYKINNNEAVMTYKQFINYLYAELFIDDRYDSGGQIIEPYEEKPILCENCGYTWDKKEMAFGGNVDCGCEHSMEEGGNIDTWIISALTSNNEILSEKINHPITHKEIFDKYKKDGYTIVECQIYKVSNISVIDNYKNALEKYILSKYGQSIKWGKTFIPYEIIGEKIIISDTLVITNSGKEVNVKPKDLFNYYSGGGEIIEPYEENTIAEQKLNELDKGIKIESTEHSETLDKLESGEIDTSEAIREIAETHIEENPNYYKSEDLKLNNMYYIKKEDLGVLDSSPIIVVGTEFYSENGNEKWIVEYFTDKEIKLKHTPKSVLSNELGEKSLTYEQVLELFKNNHLSIKNILNDRELELALSLIKKEISNINHIEKHKVLEAEKEELSKKPPKIIRIVNGIEINDSDISDNKLLK